VHDSVTGLLIQFKVGPDGLARLRLMGKDLPFGNREIGFGTDGIEAFSGTMTTGFCDIPTD